MKDLNINLIKTSDKIYVDDRNDKSIPLENHYGISKGNGKNDTWNYCFYILERKNIPEIRVIKDFDSQEKAENYFFLKQLNDYFMNKYIIPNRDYTIEEWSLETVKNDMRRLGIPKKYLSYENNKNKNSIYYFKEDDLWYQGYINECGELYCRSKKGNDESSWMFSLYANRVYVLYLFDLYKKELSDRKKMDVQFSDDDIATIIGYK